MLRVSATELGTAAHPNAEPGADPAGAHCSPEQGCITCGDVAVPLTVQLIDADRGLALCEDRHRRRETVEVALVAPVAVGDELLVHAGTAIAHLGTPTHPGTPPQGIHPATNPDTPGREAEEVSGL